MAHPYHHAESSARKYGGRPESYLPLHAWFDQTKELMADFRHRALRHHAQGIFEAERVFGVTIVVKLDDGRIRQVPTRLLGEQHVREDLGFIPQASDWLLAIQPTSWMLRGYPLDNPPT
jgi:hypothetical protein